MISSPELETVIDAWAAYAATIDDWEVLVKGIESKATDCGPVYDVPNPIDQPNTSFAIADMRDLDFTGPHYHANGEVEIYIVLTGLGRVFVGGHKSQLKPGSISVTPPNTAHFTIPTSNLVLAVVNTPPFNPGNAISISETDLAVGFDRQQFDRLTQSTTS